MQCDTCVFFFSSFPLFPTGDDGPRLVHVVESLTQQHPGVPLFVFGASSGGAMALARGCFSFLHYYSIYCSSISINYYESESDCSNFDFTGALRS